ncbi:hypothetical protein [Saccharopolyspora hattusasensis]|uniref:hypothetical protein n=1 Tax=Saccharopolyspora hattusasensis TaxID=1128679 RepID=UPI003D9720F5
MGDIQAGITTADQLAQDTQQALAQAADHLSEALHSLIQTTQGSQNDEIGYVATTYEDIIEQIKRLHGNIWPCREKLDKYKNML